MTEPDRRLRQFGLRHLMVLLTAAPILFAIVAPYFREWDRERQLLVTVRSLVILAIALGILLCLLYSRERVERRAGPLIELCENVESKILDWILSLGMLIGYLAMMLFSYEAEDFGPARYFPGIPYFFFFTINYLVVRLWWNIDPQGLEIREHGFILSGFRVFLWSEIARYSWSAKPANQLTLFLKCREVINLKINQAFIETIDKHLAERVGSAKTSDRCPQ